MTAMALTANNPIAPKRAARPISKSVGKNSSPKVPATAAACGGSTGVWYSCWNRYNVESHEISFKYPDFKNCQLTYPRAIKAKGACKWFKSFASGAFKWDTGEKKFMEIS